MVLFLFVNHSDLIILQSSDDSNADSSAFTNYVRVITSNNRKAQCHVEINAQLSHNTKKLVTGRLVYFLSTPLVRIFTS